MLRIETAFLRTRVARRVLGLFVLCALLPIVALTIISYVTVARQLNQQSQARMLETGKAAVMSILERLQFLRTELGAVALTLRHGSADAFEIPAGSGSTTRIRALTVSRRGGVSTRLAGAAMSSLPRLTAEAVTHLRGDSTLLLVVPGDSASAAILMVRAINSADLDAGLLWADLDRRYLLAGPEGAGLPPDIEMCVFDATRRPLLCTTGRPEPVLTGLGPALATADQGLFDWEQDGHGYVASYRPLFLAGEYATPSWTIALSQTKAGVLAPLTQFRRFFLPVILLALWVVLLLSNVQIRRSMDPLVELQKGTIRIAARDFSSRVHVESGDEFEDLAASFNAMARRLGAQFDTLAAINEIDRAVLSTLDADHIVDTVVRRTQDVFACDAVTVAVRPVNGDVGLWRLVAVEMQGGGRAALDIRMTHAEVEELQAHPEHFQLLDGDGRRRSYVNVPPLTERTLRTFLVLPVLLKGEPSGVIALGYETQPALGDEELVQARQLADQVAVALSNTHLVEELDALNWGALNALARAIDAKSPWTAGHSERVTAMALMIGREMRLAPDQIEILHRGGLLHDLGKIGVPASILDKPRRLTDDERRLMQQHPEIGARILSPVAAFSPMIPIVLYHHERWDGAGYPEGLAGEKIPFLARLLAVPDVFDAVTSERPYRAGFPLDEALKFMAERRGTHFDPVILDAFLAAMAHRGEGAAVPSVAGRVS